ncbi:MAG: hypothetical protein IKF82_02415 [Bacilli bacterium]|nr:hypothetical protein [Bacilli bacterium]
MDLKCLIKLLLEKDIIQEGVPTCRIGDDVIMSAFKYRYEEVFKKITESKYDKTNICIIKAPYDKNMFCILNIKNLEKGLVHIGDNRESFTFIKTRYGLGAFPYRKLRLIINNNTKFYVKKDYYDINENIIEIVNRELRKQRIERENRKKNEVLDFLSQLP